MLVLEYCSCKVLFESLIKNLLVVSICRLTLVRICQKAFVRMLLYSWLYTALLLCCGCFLNFLVRPTTLLSNCSSLRKRMNWCHVVFKFIGQKRSMQNCYILGQTRLEKALKYFLSFPIALRQHLRRNSLLSARLLTCLYCLFTEGRLSACIWSWFSLLQAFYLGLPRLCPQSHSSMDVSVLLESLGHFKLLSCCKGISHGKDDVQSVFSWTTQHFGKLQC